MAKTNKYDKRHYNNLSAYARQVEAVYLSAIKEAAAIGALITDFDPNRAFSFADYPVTRKRIKSLLQGLNRGLQTVIVNGIKSEWTLANNKNNEICHQVFGRAYGHLSKEQEKRYLSTNETARDAFIQRRTAGLRLSDRVWNYTNQFKEEIEAGLDLGIRTGKSADELSRDLRMFLKYPDKLFRRVRDEHGELQLSKNAAAFHPGRGVYRSSYKNARRLAVTECNIAYRTADHLRWQQMDFVVGILIEPSDTNHPVRDICDDLKGRYPKNFKWTGWHPHCRCHATPILKTEDEVAEDNNRIIQGGEVSPDSVNTVTTPPDGFVKWIKENGSRIDEARKHDTLPYFIRDNAKRVNGILSGIEDAQNSKKTSTIMEQIVVQDKKMFTTEQVNNMKELEKALGVKRGLAMTFEEANESRCNPFYSTGKFAYTANCQCCSVTFEMRRRGFDVRAIEREKTGFTQTLAYSSNRSMAFIDPKTGKEPSGVYAGGHNVSRTGRVITKTDSELIKEAETATMNTGRYQLSLGWKGGGGHRLSAERHSDGSLIVYDPQTGMRYKGFSGYVAAKKGLIDIGRRIHILRTDNMLINPKYIDKIVKKS